MDAREPSAFFHPLNAKLNNLNFHQLEVVSRYRDPQLQVGENYSSLFNLRPNIFANLGFREGRGTMAIKRGDLPMSLVAARFRVPLGAGFSEKYVSSLSILGHCFLMLCPWGRHLNLKCK